MKSFPTLTYPQTPPDIKRWFYDRGLTVTDWAKDNGFPRAVVYAALAGRTRGFRGQAHAAAVALGLKINLSEVNTAVKGNQDINVTPNVRELNQERKELAEII
jgi:gp16 family phage-associated protein